MIKKYRKHAFETFGWRQAWPHSASIFRNKQDLWVHDIIWSSTDSVATPSSLLRGATLASAGEDGNIEGMVIFVTLNRLLIASWSYSSGNIYSME